MWTTVLEASTSASAVEWARAHPIVSGAVALVCVAAAAYMFMCRDRSGKLPPRFSYLIPALSGSFDLANKGPCGLVQAGYDQHGSCFRIKIGHRNVIFLIGPDAHRALMEPNDSICSPSEPYQFTVPVFGPNIVYGAPMEVMRQQLKFVSTGLTGPVMQAHCLKVVEEVQKYFQKLPASGEFDMFTVFGDLVIHTACRCLLGSHFAKFLSSDIAHLYQDLSDGMNHLTVFAPTLPTAKHRARDRARAKMVELFQKAIQERRDSGKKEEDYLQVLMDAKYKDGTSPTDPEIHGLLLAALFAGQHTSSITSTWLGAHICNDRKLFDRLSEEQRTVMAKHNDHVSLDSLADMELLNSCMKEVLRMYPPLVVLMRKLKVDHKFADFLLPKDDIVAVCPPVAHQLPKVYANPAQFNPDRWLGANAEGQEKYSFIAFGGGRHACLGERFGFLQVKTIWGYLVRHFEFEMVKKDGIPKVDFDHIVAGPRPPLMVRYKRRADPIGEDQKFE